MPRIGPLLRVRRLLPALGPAFVAAIAYVDPGNFATNLSGGAAFGYTLVWVVVLANLMAMLVQYLSAKLGLATGADLAALCRDRLPVAGRRLMWAQAEVVAMATDLAEFVGAAVALQLLFGLPALAAGLVTAVASAAVLGLRRAGRRWFEAVIVAFLAVVAAGFGFELLAAGPDPAAVLEGLRPRFAGSGSLLLATGIVGATVMPHAVYVHSSLAARAAGRTQPHAVLEISPVARDRARLRGHRVDVVTALTLAGAVNVAMLVTAARLLPGLGPLADLGQAHAALAAAAGGGAALVFALALLASGLSSASVGTCAGEVVMEGLLGRRVPVWARRAVTMIPALVVLGAGANTGTALLLSQVVLSLGLPFTLVPLVLLTRSRAVMGALVNRAATTAAAVTVTVAVTALNVVLLAQVVRW